LPVRTEDYSIVPIATFVSISHGNNNNNNNNNKQQQPGPQRMIHPLIVDCGLWMAWHFFFGSKTITKRRRHPLVLDFFFLRDCVGYVVIANLEIMWHLASIILDSSVIVGDTNHGQLGVSQCSYSLQ
jgi:hypothetical protein